MLRCYACVCVNCFVSWSKIFLAVGSFNASVQAFCYNNIHFACITLPASLFCRKPCFTFSVHHEIISGIPKYCFATSVHCQTVSWDVKHRILLPFSQVMLPKKQAIMLNIPFYHLAASFCCQTVSCDVKHHICWPCNQCFAVKHQAAMLNIIFYLSCSQFLLSNSKLWC